MAMSGGREIENYAFATCAANRGLQPSKDKFPQNGNVGGRGIEKPRIVARAANRRLQVVEGQIPS